MDLVQDVTLVIKCIFSNSLEKYWITLNLEWRDMYGPWYVFWQTLRWCWTCVRPVYRDRDKSSILSTSTSYKWQTVPSTPPYNCVSGTRHWTTAVARWSHIGKHRVVHSHLMNDWWMNYVFYSTSISIKYIHYIHVKTTQNQIQIQWSL